MSKNSENKRIVSLANARVPHELPAVADNAVLMAGRVPPEVHALVGPSVPLAMAPAVPPTDPATALAPTPPPAQVQPERTQAP